MTGVRPSWYPFYFWWLFHVSAGQHTCPAHRSHDTSRAVQFARNAQRSDFMPPDLQPPKSELTRLTSCYLFCP